LSLRRQRHLTRGLSSGLASVGPAAALALTLVACGEATPPAALAPGGGEAPTGRSRVAPAPAAATSAAAAQAKVAVTLLYTSDEHGWLLAHADKDGTLRGGAAEILGQLSAREGHGPLAPPSKGGEGPATLLLSGGDNYTGPAISSYFDGEPMAEALARMGYAASAFGNHEFDFGRQRFVQNRARAGLVYLAANVHAEDPALKPEMDLPAFQVFERRGARIGVVGLATETSLTTAMASRFAGVAIEAEEPALDRAVKAAWESGPDALVLIAHECPDRLAPMLERHPEWRLSFALGGHCHKIVKVDAAGGTPLYSPGWRFESYLRVRLTIDPSRPARARVVTAEPELVEVTRREGDAAPVDAELARSIAQWKVKLDAALGEPIGYAAMGFDKDSPEIARWITEAWRRELKVDVAIVNTGGIRQSLPKGAITKATLWSVLPFDNKLVVCELLGRDLVADLALEEAAYSGVVKVGEGYRLANGAPLDMNRRYRVATVDFLYAGGANFPFQKQDPKPHETGLDWRAPIIAWMKAQKTSERTPLERFVAAGVVTAAAATKHR
jgi:5'-nucleotidase / UDP-sugar diphosphatase